MRNPSPKDSRGPAALLRWRRRATARARLWSWPTDVELAGLRTKSLCSRTGRCASQSTQAEFFTFPLRMWVGKL